MNVDRRYTRQDMESFVCHCLELASNFKPSNTAPKEHDTFMKAYWSGPMFRNSVWFPWIEKVDVKVSFKGIPLTVNNDYYVSEDGLTITFKKPLL
jgi:hypothetical protein